MCEDGPSNNGSANDAGAAGTNLCSALKKRFESCGAGLQVKTIKKLNLRIQRYLAGVGAQLDQTLSFGLGLT